MNFANKKEKQSMAELCSKLWNKKSGKNENGTRIYKNYSKWIKMKTYENK